MVQSFLLCLVILLPTAIMTRSPFRPVDLSLPTVEAKYAHQPQAKPFTLSDSHLHATLFSHFDIDYFTKHLLPSGPIAFRYEPEKTVEGAQLDLLMNDLIEQISKLEPNVKHIEFKQFKILKIRDVDHRNLTGLYVVKFNDYPFIVKLFIESAEAFVEPTEKGFEPTCFFYMAGGVGRHITGFTRISNMEEIKHLTKNHPYWSTQLDFPRKWFWLPKKQAWLDVQGKNIGPNGTISMKIPAIYAVVCDEIVWNRPFSMKNKEDRDMAIALSNFLDQRIDLHINNFGIEKQTNKLTLIDFEHFPTVVGLKEKRNCSGYFEWYAHLSMKMLKEMMFRNKKERRQLQYAAYQRY